MRRGPSSKADPFQHLTHQRPIKQASVPGLPGRALSSVQGFNAILPLLRTAVDFISRSPFARRLFPFSLESSLPKQEKTNQQHNNPTPHLPSPEGTLPSSAVACLFFSGPLQD